MLATLLEPDRTTAAAARRASPLARALVVAACALTLALPAQRVAAEGESTEGARVEGPPMTALAAGELGRASHVVLGSVKRLRDVRGLMIAHVQVERWLRGSGSPDEITVMVAGPRPSLDAKAPSQPYFDRRTGVSYVMFLVRRAEGEAFELDNRQAIEGLEGAERLRAVESQIALAAVPQADVRARRVLEHFLGGLEARGQWTRSNAARELNYLAGVRPDLFDGLARVRIARASESASSPTMRTWLKALERRLEAAPDVAAPPPAPPPPAVGLLPLGAAPAARPAAPQPPEVESHDAFVARVAASLAEAGPQAPARADHLLRRLTDPTQRAAIVDWLAGSHLASALPTLRAHYDREDDPGVREAVVRAHGLLGGDGDVPWVVERLPNQRLQEAALLALARIRTPAARAALQSFADQRRGGDEEARALAERVDHLLSPAFEAAEPPRTAPSGPDR
jgi:hypothetical protein